MQDKIIIFSFILFSLNFVFSCFIYIGLLKVESVLSDLQEDIKCYFE